MIDMHIKVIRLDGTAPSILDYFMRWIFRVLDITISSGNIGVVSMIVTKNGQRLGDLAAGTTLIKTTLSHGFDNTMYMEVTKDDTHQYSEVAQFTDRQIARIKEIRDQAIKSKKSALMEDLAVKVEEIANVKRDNQSAREFINQVIKDYNVL